MALERGFERVRERSSRFAELHERVEKAVFSWPFLAELEYCTRQIKDAFPKAVDARLGQIEKVKDISVSAAVRPLRNIERATDRFLGVLGSLRLGNIPGELVEFVAWCFERIGRPDPPFAIAIDDKVAMLTMIEILAQQGFKEVFPEFYDVFEEQRVGHFVVLLLPEQLLQRSSSLNWSVLAHEVGHAYVEESRVVSERFPRMPTSWTELRALVQTGTEEDKKEARDLMQLNEYACDEVAVRLTGCAFAWRLLTDFFSLEQVPSTSMHPQIDKRVRRAARLASELGFTKQSDQIVSLLEQETRDVAVTVTDDDVPQVHLEAISAAIKKAIPASKHSDIASLCRDHVPALSTEDAAKELRSGRPLALDPWAVLCLATPDETIHASEKLQEIIADAIRLGQVRSRFRKIVKTDAS